MSLYLQTCYPFSHVRHPGLSKADSSSCPLIIICLKYKMVKLLLGSRNQGISKQKNVLVFVLKLGLTVYGQNTFIIIVPY